MLPIKSALPIVSLLLILSAPALGQDAGAAPLRIDGEALWFDAQDHQLKLPMPPWADPIPATAEDLAQSTTSRFIDDGTLARVDLFPRGEGEAFWTSLYGARISRQANPVLADFRAVVVEVYSRNCNPDTTGFFQLEADQGDMLPPLGFVCGAYLGLTPETRGKGEIMVAGFYKSDDALAMVYREWRGDAFDPTNAATWPVTPQQVQAEIERLKSVPVLTRLD